MALVRVYCGLASAPPAASQEPAIALLTVAVVDDSGRLLDVCDITDDAAGYAELGAVLAERSGGSAGVAVAADSDEHQVTLLLAAAGRPLAVADEESIDDYAERFCDDESAEEIQAPPNLRRAVGLARALQAGAAAAHTQAPPRELILLKPVLAAHGALATGRQGAAVALREVLRELYPAALRAYPDPAEPIPLAILDALPEPGLLGSGAMNRARDAEVAAELAGTGLADEKTIAQAITALRVASTETPRRAGIGKSLTTAVAATIRQSVAAVRAFDNGVLALMDLLAEKTTPTAGPGRVPAMPPGARGGRVPDARRADEPATARAGRGLAGEPPVGHRREAEHRGDGAAGARRPSGLPLDTGLASTPHPVPGARRHLDDPIMDRGREPAAEPAGFKEPARSRGHGEPVRGRDPVPTSRRGGERAEPSRGREPSEPPHRVPRGLPIEAEALRAVSGAIPSLTPVPPATTHAAPSHAVPDHAADDDFPPTLPHPGAPRADLAGRRTPGRSGPGAGAGIPVESAPPADPYAAVAIPLARDAAGRGTPGRGGRPDDDHHLPRPAPEVAAPGSRDDWPLNPARDQDDMALGPVGRTELAAEGPGLDPPARRRDSRVAPPWQADDMPGEPGGLRLVDPAPSADRAPDPFTERPPHDDRGRRSDRPSRDPMAERRDPMAERRGPARDERRGAAAFPSRSGEGRRGADPVAEAPPPLRLVEPDVTDPYDPVDSDGDGDLLIFAQARSAWFTGELSEDPSLSWDNPADLGWRAAERATSPVLGDETVAGLPRRVPQANLVPGSPLPPADRTPLRIVRDPAALAAHTTGYFRGSRQGEQVRGFAVGGRPGREAAGGWDFSRDTWESDHDDGYEYRSAARR